MPHHLRHHRYDDSDDPPPSSSGSEDGNESTDASDEVARMIRMLGRATRCIDGRAETLCREALERDMVLGRSTGSGDDLVVSWVREALDGRYCRKA